MARVSRKNKHIEGTPQKAKYQIGIYVRLSVEDIRKKENHSIDTQKELVREYISKMEDAEIVELYEDINYTGTNFNRPSFEKMIDDAKQKKINCIVVKDLSRFGRNYIEAGQYMEYVFPFLGVRFISINDKFDSFHSNSSDGLIIPIKNLMNEVYARDISKKVKSQYQVKRNRGDFCGAFAPYGYIKEGSKLKIDDEVAPVVKMIFEYFLSGMGDLLIAKKMNETEHFPPRRYHYEKGFVKDKRGTDLVLWHRSVIKRILTNPIYTGNMIGGKFRGTLFDDARALQREEDIVICPNTHIAIISQIDFDRATLLRDEKRNTYENSLNGIKSKLSKENIFKGFVYCEDCGRLMDRHKTVKVKNRLEYRYLCRTYETVGKDRCSRKYFLEETLSEITWQAVKKQIDMFIETQKIINKSIHIQSNNKILGTNKSSLYKLQKRLDALQVMEHSLYGNYVDKILSEKEYLDLKKQCINESEEIKKKIDQTVSDTLGHTERINQNNIWYGEMTKFKNAEALSENLISSLLEKIEIDGSNNVSITFKYNDELQRLMSELEKKQSNAEEVAYA